MNGTMEYLYKERYKFYPFRHYENLLKAGYTYLEAGRIVQDNMDKVWNLIRRDSEAVHPREASEKEENFVEPVPLEWL